MQEEKKLPKIGELFIGAGILSSQKLDERLAEAKAQSLPLGRMLVNQGDLTNYGLLSIVQIQSLLLDGLLNMQSAVDASRYVATNEHDFDSALKKAGFAEENPRTCKLGELLLEANLINQRNLFSSLAASFESCLPLGMTLVQRGLVPPAIIDKALELQREARSGKITRSQAIDQLKETAVKSGVKITGEIVIRKPEVPPQTPAPPATPKDPLKDLRERAVAAYRTGKYAEAEKLYAAALKEAEKLGEKSEEYLVGLSDMASFYVTRGEFGIAQSLVEKAYIVASRFLPPGHPRLDNLKMKHEALSVRKDTGSMPPGIIWL